MTAPLEPVSATHVTPAAQQSRTPCSAERENCSGVVASFRARIARIHGANSRSAFLPARWVSSRWVWQLTSPGTSAPSGNASRWALAGAGTARSGPTAAIRPVSSTGTARSMMGGAVTGCTERARMRSIRGSGLGPRGSEPAGRTPEPLTPDPEPPASRRHTDAERRMHGARLRRLGARIEPVPVAHVLRTEHCGEVAVRPVHLTGNQGIGPLPVGRLRPAVVDVAHERRPGRRHDPTAPGVVLEDALLNVITHPDARHELRCIPDEPGVGVVVGGAGLAGRRDREPRLPHGAERGAAADHVFHHVDHQPGVLGVHHLLAPRVGFPEDVPLAVLDAEY